MKKLVVGLTIAVLAASVLATNMWLDLRAERSRARELATQVSAAEARQLVRAVAEPTPAAAAVAKASPPAVPPAPAAAPAARQPDKPKADSPLSGILEAMTTPEGKDAMRGMMRTMMAQLYPDIEKELGLTAQEKQQLFDLLADEGQGTTDLILGAQDPREMQRRMVEAELAQEAKVSALLGSKYPKWEEYQSTSQARLQVDQLRRSLAVAGNPLSDPQSQQLVAAFAVEQRRAAQKEREWSRSPAAINSPNMMQETVQHAVDVQSRLLEVAAPILDAEQLDRFKRQVEMQTAVLRNTMSLLPGANTP